MPVDLRGVREGFAEDHDHVDVVEGTRRRTIVHVGCDAAVAADEVAHGFRRVAGRRLHRVDAGVVEHPAHEPVAFVVLRLIPRRPPGAVRVVRLAELVAGLVELSGVVQVDERQREHRDATDQVAHPSTRVRTRSGSRVAPGQEPQRPPAHGGKDENCDPQQYDVPGSHHLGEEARLGEVDEVRGKDRLEAELQLGVVGEGETSGDEGDEAGSHGQATHQRPGRQHHGPHDG